MSNLKIPFGITKDEEIVYIQDKNVLEKEKYKNCFCYECGSPLIARLGEKNIWHFAHKNSDKKCSATTESWLHKYAKQIIMQNKYITIPGLWASQYIDSNNFSDFIYKSKMFEPYKSKYNIVALEKNYKEFKPDAIIQLENGIEIAIEIRVTHKVDKNKKEKVKKSNLDMIEICLDPEDLIIYDVQNPLDEISLKNLILHESYRKWINKVPTKYLENKKNKLLKKMNKL